MNLADDGGQFGELGVAVVHHASPRELLDDSLKRLAESAPGATVVVVATGSAVPSPASCWPHGTTVIGVPNRSYSYAVNRGLEAVGDKRYLALMNDDVLVGEGTFGDLITVLDGVPGTGVVGPVPLDAGGEPQDLGLPYRLAYARARRGDGCSSPRSAAVGWLAGCLKVMTREAFVATGGYDEGFRFTNEDLDFCLRARRLGYPSRLVESEVTHLGGTSTPSDPSFHVEGRRGGFIVTRRHLPPVARPLHRAYLLLEGGAGSVLARSAAARSAHGRVARMALAGEWEPGPFGETLDDR